MTIPGLPLDEGLGSISWYRESSATMLRFAFSIVAGFTHAAPRFLELSDAVFDAQFWVRKRSERVRVRLEAIVPEGATPFAPLEIDAPFWQSVNALRTHLGGSTTLPLPDGPSGTLESGRPYVASAESTWSHAGIEVRVRTNRLEHVVVFDILGPDPRTRPRARTRRKKQ
jgi:hypothetical protein